MPLHDELERQGNWLFRWRSYLPLVFAPVLLIAFVNVQWPFKSFMLHEEWETVGLVLSFFGLGIRVLAVGYTPAGTSGRNTKQQCAQSLNTTGAYSVVRHPLYLGNYCIGLGVVLVPFKWWLPVIYTLAFFLYYERIMYAEEDFLRRKFRDRFDRWASRTPAFIPRLSQWQASSHRFSLRTVLKREYTGLLLIVALHASSEFLEVWLLENRLINEGFWIVLTVFGTGSYAVLRVLKKRTRMLDVPGR